MLFEAELDDHTRDIFDVLDGLGDRLTLGVTALEVWTNREEAALIERLDLNRKTIAV